LNSSLREFCIGLAVLKPISKLEFAIEKCTELGASRLMLFNSERSKDINLRFIRLNSVVRSAVKQSLQSKIPELAIAKRLEDVASQGYAYEEKIVLHEKSNDMVDDYLSGLKKRTSVIALVGPEGGFSGNEINFLIGKGFKSFSIGKSRLRSETATIKIASLLAVY
jgi:16S rRNA (uracil1498-N3)-methyltransferase